MNKIQIQSLQDYLAEPTPINLKLFALSVSPNPYKATELKSLIEKYRKDPSKLRQSAIEVYLGAVKGTKKASSKAPKAINYLPKGVSQDKLDQLSELKFKYTLNLSKAGSKAAQEQNEVLRGQIDDLETQMGLKYDYKNIPVTSIEESERAVLLGVLGDWTDPKSISWELLNGTKTYFEVVDNGKQNTAGFGMAGLVASLQKFSGKPVRPFNIQFVFPQGTAGKAKWTFSLNPQMNSVELMTQTLNTYNSDLEKLG